jgi:hypothetical protein
MQHPQPMLHSHLHSLAERTLQTICPSNIITQQLARFK